MSRDNKHDIDFFKGNKPKDDSQVKSKDIESNTYKYDDFKFNNKKKTVVNPSLNLDDESPLFQRDKKEEEIRLAQYRRMKREKELEEAKKNDKRLQKQEQDRLKEQARLEQLNKNPRVASGERKPLKPVRANNDNPVNNNKRPRKQRKGNFKKKVLITKIVLIIIFILLLAFGSLYALTKFSPTTNFVMIGTDQREGQAESEVRADALMNVTVSSRDNKMLLASIPRDTLTTIPCENNEKDKITHAYSYGGANWGEGGGIKCTVEAVNNLVEVKSEKYVKLNFENTIDIINDMGGIDLKATASFCEQDSKGRKDKTNRKCFEKGQTYHMDGEQALAYARHRKSDNDIERGLRQQEVFKAMFSKAKKLNIFQLFNFAKKMNDLLDNNLNFIQKAQIILIYATNGDIDNYKFDWSGIYYNGVSYVELDLASLNRYIKTIHDME